jgi:hypothetical protein
LDFTILTYKRLLKSLINSGYNFIRADEYFRLKNHEDKLPLKLIILRHDVEAKYYNALILAEIQHKLGISGTYYFRSMNRPDNDSIIEKLAKLDHEIGYHYDDLSRCKGSYNKAIIRFKDNIDYLRKFGPVNTITMEGAPLSKYDNRDLWKKFDYRDFDIVAEPYYDMDFNEIFYITDTGRRWNSNNYNIRDKSLSKISNEEFLSKNYISTNDIIKDVEFNRFPDKAMINFHPQRWTNKQLPWLKELVWQNIKNQGKAILSLIRK